MFSVMKRASFLPALAALAFTQSACGLVPIEVTADGRLQFEVRGETNTYSSIETYDLNDNEDYRNYKDQFSRGEIDAIQIDVLRVTSANQATWVAGQVDVREHTDDPNAPWVEGVSAWGGLRLMGESASGRMEPLLDSIYLNPASFDNYGELNQVVFQDTSGVLDFRVQGVGDQGPVEFDIEVTVTFTVEN